MDSTISFPASPNHGRISVHVSTDNVPFPIGFTFKNDTEESSFNVSTQVAKAICAHIIGNI